MYAQTEIFGKAPERMLQHLFHIGQPQTSVNAKLATAQTPASIVRSCMNQLLVQAQKKDKELRDLIQVRG